MTSITYKDSLGNPVQLCEFFTGYEIKQEYKRVSAITEYVNGEPIGTITFRPTKIPVIFKVHYLPYMEDRYSHGGIRSRYTIHNGYLCGEYRKFSTEGVLEERRFFFDEHEVTNEIKTFLNFKGTNDEFLQYEFKEDELFNLCIRYGSYFKFLTEYSFEPSKFDAIVKYCTQ